jgi:hypothetical protein
MKMMTAWKDSLSIFTPKKFKLFFLVTLNALKQAYQVFFKYWWWLFVTYVLIDLSELLQLRFLYQMRSDLIGETILASAVYGLLLFIFFLSMRPSVDRKNLRYFSSYCLHGLYYLLGIVTLTGFSYLGMFAIKNTLTPHFSLFIAACASYSFALLIIVLQYFFAMFLLDNEASLSATFMALYRAAKMVLYNLPFVIAMMVFTIFMYLLLICLMILIGYISDYSLSYAISLIVSLVFFLWLFITMTFSICFVANFYTQKLYEQYSLYFKENN